MRKKFFATMIVVAAFAGYNVYQSQNTNTLSDLALANVEALAQSGEGGGGTIYCCGGGECMKVVDGNGNGNVNPIAGTRFSSPCP